MRVVTSCSGIGIEVSNRARVALIRPLLGVLEAPADGREAGCRLIPPVVNGSHVKFSNRDRARKGKDSNPIQLCAVDHLARRSMKNAANCVSECELQDT